jgi:pimeloyl-ACP methyl ester carboxylesterase
VSTLGLLHPGPDSDYGPEGRSQWLDIDWSEHLRQVSVGGSRVNFAELGPADAPAIFMVHGLGAMWQCWLENMPHFARDHRVIAMDLPGFGGSEMPAWDISIENYGRWLFDFAEVLGVESATVVGNSMGGFIGAEAAIKEPARVERLALVSAAIFWQEYRRAKPLLSLARATDAAAAHFAVAVTRAGAMRPRLRHATLAAAGFRYPHLLSREMQIELIRTARRTEGFVGALGALADYPLREELPRIAAPTLVVWGAHDTLVGVKHAHETSRLIPNSETVIFERTGHEAMIERPARFNRVLREFIEQTEPFSGDADLGPEGDRYDLDRAEPGASS